jgi:type II secretory pathway predicted ATPase ExeA
MFEASTAHDLPVSSPPAEHLTPLENPASQQAFERVSAALAERRIVALVGLQGVGKSTLMQALAAALGSAASMQRQPDEKLRTKALLIDDAHRLADAELASLVAWRYGLVLAGPYSLVERLAGLRRRFVMVDLAPLRPDARETLLSAMLERAGEPASLLPPAMMATLGRQSGGRIGPLLDMARLAIFLARLEGGNVVRPQHVEQASAVGEDVEIYEDEPAAPLAAVGDRRLSGIALVGVAICVTAALAAVPAFLWQPWNAHSKTALPASILRPPSTPDFGLAALHTLVLSPQSPPEKPPALPAMPSVPFGVVIHVPAGDAAALQQGVRLAAELRRRGYDVDGPAVETHWRMPSITYYFEEDAAAATALAAVLDNQFGVPRQADHAESLPPPGQADIMLAGSRHVSGQGYRLRRQATVAKTPDVLSSAGAFTARTIAGLGRFLGLGGR